MKKYNTNTKKIKYMKYNRLPLNKFKTNKWIVNLSKH